MHLNVQFFGEQGHGRGLSTTSGAFEEQQSLT